MSVFLRRSLRIHEAKFSRGAEINTFKRILKGIPASVPYLFYFSKDLAREKDWAQNVYLAGIAAGWQDVAGRMDVKSRP